MKRIITLLLTVLCTVVADAQTTNTANISFSVEPASLKSAYDEYDNYTDFYVSINMNNDVPIMAVQFDLELPEGITVVDGYRSTRCSSGMTVSVNDYGAAERVVLVGMDHPLISGKEGKIVTLRLRAQNDARKYVEPILFSEDFNIRFSQVSCSCKFDKSSWYGISVHVPDFYGNVKVDASDLDYYPLGDLDKTKDVTYLDLQAAVKGLVDNDPAIKARKEADVNWDGNFSIGDIVALINRLK